MHIIFTASIIKNCPRSRLALSVLLLCVAVGAQECQPFSYQTSFTKCKISLEQCISTPQQQAKQAHEPEYRFKSCQIEHCSSLGAGPDCHSFITMHLDEKQCFQACCQSKGFHPSTCATKNVSLKQKEEAMNGRLAIIFASIVVGLVIVICCFMVFKLRVLEKKPLLQSQPSAEEWRKMPFTDRKCQICEQYGAIVETACCHFFHPDCFRKTMKAEQLTGECPKCSKVSRRFRLWCSGCHQKSIRILIDEVETVEQLQKYYEQVKVYHQDCLMDINDCLKTDMRLTSSSSGNEI